MHSAEAIHSIIAKTRQVSQSIEKEKDAVRKLVTSKTKCKEICNQELEEEVLKSEQSAVRQKLELNSLLDQEATIMKSLKEKAQEYDMLQLMERKELLFSVAEEYQLKLHQKLTRSYFESAPEFERLDALEQEQEVMARGKWAENLLALQNTERETLMETDILRQGILDASAVSHEYRMKLTSVKASLGRLQTTHNLEKRHLESQLCETQSYRKNLDQRIPAADAELREKRLNIARLERELQQLQAAMRY